MQTNDIDGPSENEEIQKRQDFSGRVAGANPEEARKRLKELVLKKSRERLSLLEKGKENVTARAEERKDELINIAAVDYDLDKEEIEKKYAERIEALRNPKPEAESDSVFSALASEPEQKKTPEELINEMNSLLDRLDSNLHFSEDEKSRIRDALSLKAQKGGEETKELEELKDGLERFSVDSGTVQRINALKANMQVELLELEEKFGGAVKDAEEERQRILSHVSKIAENVLAEKRKTLALFRSIDSASPESLEAMLAEAEPAEDRKIVLTEEDRAVQSSVIRTVLFSGAVVTLFGVTMHTFNKERKASEPVLDDHSATESIMKFKMEPRAFFQTAPSLLDSNGAKKPEQDKKAGAAQKAPAAKAASAAKSVNKDSIGNLEKAVKGLEKKVDLMLSIERNREQLGKIPGDGIILLKKSTKSIAKRFLVNLELELRTDRLGDRQKAALYSMLERMNLLLKIKENNKKADVTPLRCLREVPAEGFSLKSIRNARKGIDKAIAQSKPKAKPSKVRKK